MPELRISTDKVCDLIETSREIGGKVESTAGDNTTTGDDSEFAMMEDYEGNDPMAGDARREQMVEFIAGLNVEEQVDLLALIYLGRGDYDIDEWEAALDAARDRIDAGDPDYMIGDRALPGYLGSGLEAFGRSCL